MSLGWGHGRRPPQGEVGGVLMKTTTNQVWKLDKRMVPRVNAPGWSFGMWFLFYDSENCYIERNPPRGFYKHNCRVENLNAG